jgi:DNA (cytosine-5)-methyltransferase 1
VIEERASMRHRFLDFFAGAGMVEFALADAWTCVWANDLDATKQQVYQANLDPCVFHLGDVAEIDTAELPTPAAMAWASFPCQDLSLAGWRRGMGADRSGAFWAFWRLMDALHEAGTRPPLIVIENVAGLLSGPDFAGLCEALAGLDLQFGALLINADRFLPQSRPRVFIVAVDATLDVAAFLEERPEASPWFDRRVWRAYQDLTPTLQERWRWWRLPSPADPIPAIGELIDAEPTDVAWHTPAETERLLALMSPVNRAKVDEQWAKPGRAVGFVYKRTRADGQRAEVRFDGVAGCLRTPGGGSSRQTVMIVEDGHVRTRLLSPREAARLMGLPETFQSPGSYNNAYHVMGDGVVVPVVRWLGQHLLAPLAELTTEAAERDERARLRSQEALVFRANASRLAQRWARERVGT